MALLISKDPASRPTAQRLFNTGHEPLANLYTLPITGGSPKQLTFFDSFSIGGVWSADGNRIAFASTQGGKPRVWIVDAGGGLPRATSSSDLSDSFDLTRSPGSRVLYQVPGNRDYYELDPDTGVERPLVTDRSVGWVFSPVYSPDGRKIAVAWNRRPSRGIWVIDVRDRYEALVYTTSAASARRHAEQVSALAGLQLTSIVGVQPAQLAAKAVTSSSTRSTLAGSAYLLPVWRRCYGSHVRSGT